MSNETRRVAAIAGPAPPPHTLSPLDARKRNQNGSKSPTPNLERGRLDSSLPEATTPPAARSRPRPLPSRAAPRRRLPLSVRSADPPPAHLPVGGSGDPCGGGSVSSSVVVGCNEKLRLLGSGALGWKSDMGSGNLLMKKVVRHSSFDLDIQLDKSWMEDVTCPICLDYPHNAVLLRCTSYEKGCRPFVCDTDQTRSNCLERFKGAYELPANVKVSSLAVPPLDSIIHIVPSNANNRPSCPLCRGDVIGWIVIGEARMHLNQKKRCCEEDCCSFVGNFNELQKHTQQKHPDSRPSEIDPARQVDWENFQQSSDIVDVLSTIHAQVPNGIVLGDYVIEYGDDDNGDDYEVFRRVRTNWWSCIFCKAFSRSSRSRRRARARERRGSGRRNGNQANLENFNLEVPTQSVELREIRFDEIDDEYIVTGAIPSIAAPGRMASFHYRDTRYGR